MFDTDEVFVPQKSLGTWQEMLKSIQNNARKFTNARYFVKRQKPPTKILDKSSAANISHWRFSNFYFVVGSSRSARSMPITSSLRRDKGEDGLGKSLFNTGEVEILYQHGAVKCLSGKCKKGLVQTYIGRCHHYRPQSAFARGRSKMVYMVGNPFFQYFVHK